LALAQGTLDTSTPINFNSAPYSGANLAGLSIGALSGGTSYSGTITPATSSTTLASGLVIAANTYRLGGGGTLTIPGAQLTGAGNSLVAANGGTVALNGLNTYGGTTTIKGVYVLSDANRATKNDFSAGAGALMPQILSVSHLGVGSAASSIGSSSNAAANLVIGGGTLQYTGAGDSTDRLFTMTPTGAALDASGTGPIVFSNTGSVAQTTIAPILATSFGVNSGGGVPFNRAIFPATVDTSGVALGMTVTDSAGQFPAGTVVTGVDSTATGSDVYVSYQTQIGEAFNDTLTFTVQNRALTLTGTNTGANTLDTALVNPASSGTLAINKTGVGTWFLSGANTYTGGTGVNAGILEATGTGSLPGYNVSGNITVASGGTMAVAVGGAGQFTSANIDTLRSNATFSAGSYLGIDTTSAPSGFSYASNITGVLGLNKLGANTLTLSGTDTYSGPTLVSQGTLAVTTTGSIPNSAVTVGGATAGTLNFAASTSGILVRNLTSLNIVNGSANMLAAPTATQNTVRSVLVTPSLTVGTGTDLDLANNDLIEKSTTASSVLSQIKAGFNAPSGYWNGTGGIVSTSAAGNAQYLTALGYMQSTGGSFDGVATTTSDTLVKYTYYGDANLDGSVNGGDYTQIDHGYSMNLTGWQNGDFNYDGVVDGSDYSLIDNTYNQINASGATPLAITAGAADLVASPANVPEPTTLALLGIGTIGLLGRRRRRNA